MKSLKEAEVLIKNLEILVVDLCERLESLESAPTKRDRGPASTRDMTEDDARRIMFGDLKSTSHKVAAETLGLSYGQVYSCRGGYTFKKLQDEKLSLKK